MLRWRTTPDRIRGMAAVAIALTIGLGVLITATSGSIASGLQSIGHQSDPEVLATTDLVFRLNDMDAQVANMLLVGRAGGLGINRQQAQRIYQQDRLQADQDLQKAAAVAGSGPSAQRALRPVLDELGSYEALAGEAMYLEDQGPGVPGRPPAAALVLYRQATDLLQGRILPAAHRLTQANAAALGSVYQSKRSAALHGVMWVLLTGIALLAMLTALQFYLFARYRRVLNPAVAAASVVALALVALSATAFAAQANHLRVAKVDAFNSIIALSQARATSDDANADESRYLVDPERAGQYQQAYENRSQQLVRLHGAGIFQYDAALGRAIQAYRARHTDLRFGGFFGTEFRNITFPGERAAAERTLAAYQTYERDDRHIRALNASGNLRGAIAFDTSYAHGNSNWAFTGYDNALTALIAINQRAFDQAISDGQHGLSGWTGAIPTAAVVLMTGLILAGVRPRLGEYR